MVFVYVTTESIYGQGMLNMWLHIKCPVERYIYNRNLWPVTDQFDNIWKKHEFKGFIITCDGYSGNIYKHVIEWSLISCVRTISNWSPIECQAICPVITNICLASTLFSWLRKHSFRQSTLREFHKASSVIIQRNFEWSIVLSGYRTSTEPISIQPIRPHWVTRNQLLKWTGI